MVALVSRRPAPANAIDVAQHAKDARGCLALTGLLGQLQKRNVRLVSITEGFDLSTPSGRFLAHVLASASEYERELRAERQHAGIEAHRQRNGGRCAWGGRRRGSTKHSPKQAHDLHEQGLTVPEIAREMHASTSTVKRYLKNAYPV